MLAKDGKWYDCWQIQLLKEAVIMAAKLSQEWNRTIHRVGREREYRIITGETKLTVAQIFLMDANWKIFKEHREIIGKPLSRLWRALREA